MEEIKKVRGKGGGMKGRIINMTKDLANFLYTLYLTEIAGKKTILKDATM